MTQPDFWIPQCHILIRNFLRFFPVLNSKYFMWKSLRISSCRILNVALAEFLQSLWWSSPPWKDSFTRVTYITHNYNANATCDMIDHSCSSEKPQTHTLCHHLHTSHPKLTFRSVSVCLHLGSVIHPVSWHWCFLVWY